MASANCSHGASSTNQDLSFAYSEIQAVLKEHHDSLAKTLKAHMQVEEEMMMRWLNRDINDPCTQPAVASVNSVEGSPTGVGFGGHSGQQGKPENVLPNARCDFTAGMNNDAAEHSAVVEPHTPIRDSHLGDNIRKTASESSREPGKSRRSSSNFLQIEMMPSQLDPAFLHRRRQESVHSLVSEASEPLRRETRETEKKTSLASLNGGPRAISSALGSVFSSKKQLHRAGSTDTAGPSGTESANIIGLRSAKTAALARVQDEEREAEHQKRVLEKAATARELFESKKSMQVTARTLRTRLQELVKGTCFEAFFVVVIITNSIFIGVQVDIAATSGRHALPLGFYIIQYTYASIFCLELIIRVLAQGSQFFCDSRHWYWNYLDVFIVFTSVFEAIMDAIVLGTGSDAVTTTKGASNMRIVRVLRIARIFRIIRVARILRFIHALRTFILSILATLKALVWAMLLLGLIIYVFGIILAQTSSDWLQDYGLDSSPDAPLIFTYWGTLPRAMFTLFKSISGGVSWHDIVTPLSTVGDLCVILFMCFISFTYFAVLNVVTGIFCQSAIETAQKNEDLLVQAEISNRDEYIMRFQKLFEDIDEDRSGKITFDELKESMEQESVRAVFTSLDIDVADAWTLFRLLDTDEGCEIELDEFVSGVMRMKGNAKRADVLQLQAMVKKLLSTLQDLVVLQVEAADAFTAFANPNDLRFSSGGRSSLSSTEMPMRRISTLSLNCAPTESEREQALYRSRLRALATAREKGGSLPTRRSLQPARPMVINPPSFVDDAELAAKRSTSDVDAAVANDVPSGFSYDAAPCFSAPPRSSPAPSQPPALRPAAPTQAPEPLPSQHPTSKELLHLSSTESLEIS